ncbi:MAG: small multi-drug export protein [Caldisericia bacterium]|nr:small multi-drug export protein [Caldisericia bacterium]
MKLINVLMLAMTPVGELRLSIPTGVGAGLPWFSVFLISILGNMIPAILLVFLFPYLEPLRYKRGFFLWIWFDKLLTKIESRKSVVEKYGWLGLILLVAIPFPGTGAYTGSFVSYLMRMNKAKSLFFIFVGVCIAGIIVTIFSLGFFTLFF